MPNWCNGVANIAGTKEALLNFVSNGLHFVIDESTVPIGGTLEDDVIHLHTVNLDDEYRLWVSGTHRNFATPVSRPILLHQIVDNEYQLQLDWDAAWSIESQPIADLCAAYEISFSIEAEEPGAGFMQVIEIDETGQIEVDTSEDFPDEYNEDEDED